MAIAPEKNNFFERNLLALSQTNPELCRLLSKAEAKSSRYTFLESRSGEIIPAWINAAGTAGGASSCAAQPLHSMVDPRKEAQRLVETASGAGFLVLLGLGGGYCAEAALESGAGMVLVVEYGINGLAELLHHHDYSRLFVNPRFRLLADLADAELEQRIAELYQPVLYGGIAVLPLRSRTRFQPEDFARAAEAVNASIQRVSADYSVQAHFGKRWFSNIIRNIANLNLAAKAPLPSIRRAAICAAGPSLSLQIAQLKKTREEKFIIATDTSLPCLLHSGVTPDAVISIDCQHISYHHFMNGLPRGVLLFLDLASPPLLASRYSLEGQTDFNRTYFFSSAHPLSRYVSSVYCPLPELDTSGGNVTYAAVSLAEQLGASQIELYGADFSYPAGVSYARGTYIYQVFAQRQNRLQPLQAQSSRFIFRTPVEKKISPEGDAWYYETQTLSFYRKMLEEKITSLHAELIPVQGLGAPISIHRKQPKPKQQRRGEFLPAAKALIPCREFLRLYRDKIAALHEPGENAAVYAASLNASERAVFTTLLPSAAAIGQRLQQSTDGVGGHSRFQELFAETKAHCLRAIDLLTPPV